MAQVRVVRERMESAPPEPREVIELSTAPIPTQSRNARPAVRRRALYARALGDAAIPAFHS